MWQPYIDSAALSDSDDEDVAVFSPSAEINFHHLAGYRNVCIHYKYFICKCLCKLYPLESGEVKAYMC